MSPPDPPRPRGRGVDLGSLFGALESPGPAAAKSLAGPLGERYVLIPAGTTLRGADDARPLESPRHAVVLSQSFYLATTPVTTSQYRLRPAIGDEPPATGVSWDDVQDYCRRLAALPASAGTTFRLPTEAEWEYACRAGSATAYSTGDQLADDQAAFRSGGADAEPDGVPTVGRYPANSFGLFAMHGTVWEWCADWLGPYPRSQVRDPAGPSTGTLKVLRGGSWANGRDRCRSDYRNALAPYQADSRTGFRLVLVPGGLA